MRTLHRMLQGLWVLVGCTASHPAPVAPVAHHEPASSLEAAEPSPRAEPEPTPQPSTRLWQDRGTIGWVEDIEGIDIVGRNGDELLVELPFFDHEGNRYFEARARVSEAALRRLHLEHHEVQPALRVAVHHRLELQHDDGTPIAEARCGEVEVLVEQPDRTRVRVRERGVVLEAWVEGHVSRRGPEECPPRILRRGAQAWIRGQPHPDPEPLPEGFVETHDVAVQRRGSVWWLVPGEQPHCEQWRWRRDGTILEHRTKDRRTWYSVGEDASDDSFVLFGPSFESLRPHGSSGAMGCALPVRVVDADDDRWVVISTTRFFDAYHHEDAQHWFLSADACNEARQSPIGARVGC